MRSFRLDRSVLFLVAILAILLAGGALLLIAMRTDPVSDSLSGDKLLKVLIVLEDGGRPISTNVIAYYPGTKRAAMFDVPGETGLIIKSLGRVDRIDAVHAERGIAEYKREIEELMGISVPFYVRLDLADFARLVDLLKGVSVFIPTPVDSTGPSGRVLLPSGAVTLDGDKVRTYVTYADEADQEGEASARKQKALLAFFRALGDNSQAAFSPRLFGTVRRCVGSNVDASALKSLLTELSHVDSERLVPQRVTGAQKEVDGKMLLFPFYDGQLLKDIVRQTLAGLASEGNAAQERIYAIEVLNGTKSQGLARNTSELYQSFGYDVIRIGNAENTDYDKTVVIDRIGNQAVAKAIAQVIQCANIQTTTVGAVDTDDYGTEAIVDFSIILGKDFNGRYVIGQ
jgi:anionic cell wall polymer biosynthesis LytR-Cps2A-Psr (LCP) family protein